MVTALLLPGAVHPSLAKLPSLPPVQPAPVLKTSDTSAATASPFGINGVGFFHYRDQADAPAIAERRARLLQDAGITWDRFDFWWSIIEPQKGRFDFTVPDRLIEIYRKHHIEMMPILSYSSAWAQHPPDTDEERQAFARYAAAVVKRYHPWVHAWELWNEPNIPTFWKPQPSDQAYALLVKTAAAAIRQADPTAMIVAGATSETDTVFLRNLARYGAWNSFDVISIHPYSMSDGPVETKLDLQIQRVQDLIKEAGQLKPIWITEMGWTASPAGGSRTGDSRALEDQSRYLVQSYVISLANGVSRLFWFNLVDFDEKWGLVSDQEAPKPSFRAYQAMTALLAGAHPKGMLPVVNGRAYAFEVQGHTVLVAWAERGKSASFRLSAAAAARNLYGAPLQVENGTIRLDESPRYILIPGTTLLGQAASPDPLKMYQSNLVVNGDFSVTRDGQPYGWERGTFDGSRKDSTFGVAIVRPAAGSQASPGPRLLPELSDARDACWESFYLPVQPGRIYHLRARIRPFAATGASTVSLGFLGGAGWGWRHETASPPVTGTGDWQDVEVRATAPADAAFVRVHLNSTGNTGLVRFNQVILQEERVRLAP